MAMVVLKGMDRDADGYINTAHIVAVTANTFGSGATVLTTAPTSGGGYIWKTPDTVAIVVDKIRAAERDERALIAAGQ